MIPVRRALAVLLALAVGLSACSKPPTERQILDPTRSNEEEVATLAKQRALLGARWLTTVVRDNGAFYYRYYPISDNYEEDDYNMVRHAGTLYSLWQAVGLFKDPALHEAAEKATKYIEDNLVEFDTGKGLAFEGQISLGAQALAIVALLERRRAIGDKSKDDLLRTMSSYMLSMERPGAEGRYFQSFDAETNKPIEGPDSIYYPGEALLALTRMASSVDREVYLDHAVRLADYLTKKRDGDIAQTGTIPRQDHWLGISLNELYRMQRDESYKKVCFLEADSMVANQVKQSRYPDRVGAQESHTFSYTSIATKGEAMVAAWALATFVKDEALEKKYGLAAIHTAKFQMRAQYTESNASLFPRPRIVIGAWGESRVRAYVRIDFVQHNISSLMGVWWISNDGDVPTAVAS